jgi:Uma2 family endonuclease
MENPSSSVKLTYQDLLGLPADLLRHELIDGEHHVSPAPGTKHQQVLVNLAGLLFAYLREHRRGHFLIAPFDVVLSQFDAVQPDLLYASHDRLRRRLNERHLAGAPELVVEVLSASTRRIDEGPKHRLYERYGVSEYWLIDAERETVRVYRLEGDRLDLGAELSRSRGSADQVLSTALLPGLQIPLADLFDWASDHW